MGGAAPNIVVIAGLEPAIHRSKSTLKFLMDARVTWRKDGATRLLPAHDGPRIGNPP
jgi:hypothetical protein